MESDKPKQYIDEEILSLFRTGFWRKCKEKGITLEDLSDRTGLSYIQIYRIVRGTKNTSLSNVFAVIRAAEFQPSDIFDFQISIPAYPPLRKDIKNGGERKPINTPGAKFFIRVYLENGYFDSNGLTPAEITAAVNADLDRNFSEKDFSSEFSKLFKDTRNNFFKRTSEGSTYRYFPLSEEEKKELLSKKREMRRKS